MDEHGQTSMEYLLLLGGVVVAVLIVGYLLLYSARNLQTEANNVAQNYSLTTP